MVQTSPGHSALPYLLGGLAATLGLVTFALLLLSCSYNWRISGNSNNDEESGERDVEANDAKLAAAAEVTPVAEESKVVVIMAGDVKPTFLATPMCINNERRENSGLIC